VVSRHRHCAVCAGESHQSRISLETVYGPGNLDGRPPGIGLAVMRHWLEHCPHCGHVCMDIGRSTTAAVNTVHSSAYRQLLHGNELDPLVAKFLCYAMLLEAEGKDASAGWQAVHASWVADDLGDQGAADLARLRALNVNLRLKLTQDLHPKMTRLSGWIMA